MNGRIHPGLPTPRPSDPQLGITLWIVWITCRYPSRRAGMPRTRVRADPILPEPRCRPRGSSRNRGVNSRNEAVSALVGGVDVAGQGPDRTIVTRSRSAASPLGWSPNEGGQAGCPEARSSTGGPRWSARTSPNTPPRKPWRMEYSACVLNPPLGRRSSVCSSDRSCNASPIRWARTWSAGSRSTAQPLRAGDVALATCPAGDPATRTAERARTAMSTRSRPFEGIQIHFGGSVGKSGGSLPYF